MPPSDVLAAEADFPPYPKGDDGVVVNDIVADAPIDDLFAMLYGGLTPFRLKFHEAAGYKDYVSTGWHRSLDDLNAAAAAGGGGSPPPPGAARPPAHVAAFAPGMVHHSAFGAVSMGKTYKTWELVRLVGAAPGARFELETCVQTAAPYGDRFRAVVRTVIEPFSGGGADAARATRVTARVALVYLGSINGMVRGIVEKGTKDGVGSNYAAWRRVLGGFVRVTPAAARLAAPAAAAAPAPGTPTAAPAPAAGAAAAAPPAGLAALLEAALGARLVRAAAPWGDALAAAAPVEPRAAALGLAAAAAAVALRAALELLAFVRHAAEAPRDRVAAAARLAFRLVDAPTSVTQVLAAVLLAAAVRAALDRGAAVLLGERAGGGAAAAGAAGPDAAGTPDSGARAGVRYDGYAAAVASAAAGAADAESALAGGGRSPRSGLGRLRQNVSSFRQGVRASVKETLGVGGGARAAAAAASKEAAVPEGDGEEGGDDAAGGRGRSPARPGSTAGSAGGGARLRHRGRAHGAHKRHHRHRHSRSLSVEAARLAAEDFSPLGRRAMGAAADGGGTPTPSASAAGGSGSAATPLSPAGAAPAGAGTTPRGGGLARLSPRRVFGRGAKDGSGSGADDGDGDAADRGPRFEGAASAFAPPELPKHLAAAAVAEEVFENERLQPFRGWGHTWPGHFLPTDKCAHWATRAHGGGGAAAAADARTAQDFAAVEPRLPPGWRWVEPGWRVDLAGAAAGAVDGEGWAYGLDFPWVEWPFPPGGGAKKMSDFVRRRRWMRTRVPEGSAAEGGEPARAPSPPPAAAEGARSGAPSPPPAAAAKPGPLESGIASRGDGSASPRSASPAAAPASPRAASPPSPARAPPPPAGAAPAGGSPAPPADAGAQMHKASSLAHWLQEGGGGGASASSGVSPGAAGATE